MSAELPFNEICVMTSGALSGGSDTRAGQNRVGRTMSNVCKHPPSKYSPKERG